MTQMTPSLFLLSLMASSAVLLSSCDSFSQKVPLSGKRETVLSVETSVMPDLSLAKVPVTIPTAEVNKDWPQAGGNPTHAMPHLALDAALSLTWSTNIGQGSTDEHRLTSGPVIGGGRIYTADAKGSVSAVNSSDGTITWSVNLSSDDTAEAMGGGISYDQETLYCTTFLGDLVALRAKDGKILWRKSLGAPSRVAPTIKNGHIYALTINNEIHAFNASNGMLLWSHAGISEATGILGGASPAVHNNIVITTYSSGEVFALNANTGQPIWADLLSPALRIDSIASIAHIRARPVISGDMVYIISHGGQMIATDLKTGNRLWQIDVGGIRSPAVIGDSIFMVTNDGDLICIKKQTGQIHWSAALPKLDEDKKAILWAGPIVGGNSLILTGSHGKILFASLQNGTSLKTLDMKAGSNQSPIIAEGSLYILTDEADLLKYSKEEIKS